MTLFVLRRILRNITLGVVNGKQIPPLIELIVYFAKPWGRVSHLYLCGIVVVRAAIPRLHEMRLHPLRPCLQGNVAHQSGDRHPRPHCTSVDVWLTFVLRLAPSENDLKAERPVRDCRDSNRQGVNILALVFLMRVRKLFPYPTFEVRNVARQVHAKAFNRASVNPAFANPAKGYAAAANGAASKATFSVLADGAALFEALPALKHVL